MVMTIELHNIKAVMRIKKDIDIVFYLSMIKH